MTPTERAATVLREWELPGIEEWGEMMRDDIAAAIAAAVQAERERCAALVEAIYRGGIAMAQADPAGLAVVNWESLAELAAAIREGEDG